MKTVDEVSEEIINSFIFLKTGNNNSKKILKEWAESIIDECVREARTESVGRSDGYESWEITQVDDISILKIKQKL